MIYGSEFVIIFKSFIERFLSAEGDLSGDADEMIIYSVYTR